MTLKLTLFSQEKEDFVLELLVDSDAYFVDLHQLILDACRYAELPNQNFLICDEDWHVKQRIQLADTEDTGYDEDVNLMSQTRIGDYLEDEGQHLAYMFDPDNKRFFLMELTENVFGRKEKTAVVNRRYGDAPDQILIDEELFMEEERTAQQAPSASKDEAEEGADDFYGDEGYEDEELDMEGYGIDEE